tara:strand:- start:1884 stop:1994 length:111 start_codon:yes stop_codon:yes gene_type:complete
VVVLGSLNLSNRIKKSKINIEGKNVNMRVNMGIILL